MRVGILFILYFYCNVLNSQTIDSLYYYGEENKCFIKEFVVYNNTDEDYLTWFSLDSVEGLSNSAKINTYFSKIWGDFSLLNLLYEGLVPPKGLSLIGKTFLAKIPPHGEFSYKLEEKNELSKQGSHRIVVVKRKEVECFLGLLFDDNWFYSQNKVYLK